MNSEMKLQIKTFISNFIKLCIKFIKLLPNILKTLYKEVLQRLRFSISFKITVVYTWLFTKLLIFSSILLWIICSSYMVTSAEKKVSQNLDLVKYYLANNDIIPSKQLENLSTISKTKITLFDDNKKVIFNTSKSNTFYTGNNNINKKYRFVFNGTVFNEDSISLIINNKLNLKVDSIYVQINYILADELTNSIKLLILLFCINFIFVFISIRPGAKASKKLLKPVYNMSETVNSIDVNALDTRLDVSGSQDELKDLAKAFNKMLNRLQDSYERQNEFVSDASHELRTPISVIQGYVNLLDRWGKNDTEVLEESIEAIKSEAENMKNLVENLLFLARGDKNTQVINPEEFLLNELMDEIIKETKLIASGHNIISNGSYDINLYADRKLIKQALRIFIDNSIKYTAKDGNITINYTKVNNEAIITIEDNGIGISAEDLPNIFHRFYRADKSRAKDTGGTGLGLSIAKWILLKHKGNIEVESHINVGTKFIIRLATIN